MKKKMVQDEIRRKKSGTRETPNLLTIADIGIDTMKSPLFDTFMHFCSRATYHMSCVIFTNDNGHIHRPYPYYSPFIFQ